MSSAATAGPPAKPHEPTSGDGLAGGVYASNGVSIGAGSGLRGPNRVFPHIDDLVTIQPDVNALAPIRRLLTEGELYAKQADTHLDFRRPDIALQEYIKASTIIVDLIPRHKEYPELKSDRGDLHRLYAGLQKRINIQHEKFEEIKEVIKEDNARSGVQPMVRGGSSRDLTCEQHNGESKPQPVFGQIQSSQKQLVGPLDVPQDGGQLGTSNITETPSSSLPEGNQSTRRGPPVQPKPDALHGIAIKSNLLLNPHSVSLEKDLAARFSRLRGAEPHSPVQDPRIRTQPIGMLNAADFITKRGSIPFPSPADNNTKARPDRLFGPRDMPQGPIGPPRPQKVPIDVDLPSMPKLPDAIYSPARNPDNSANLDMLRSSSRNVLGAPGRPLKVAPTSRVLRPTPATSDGNNGAAQSHRLSKWTGSKKHLDPNLPDALTVTVEELMEYLQRGSHELYILLIDVREREDFENGHIMSHSIICVDPIVLRKEISAEELAQSLILSPESEQSLFNARDTFDLVVYYDQSSTSNEKRLSGSHGVEMILGDFSKAVYDYGYEKRLKRPPRLLVGGLDAWVDLVGAGALETVQLSNSTPPGRAKGHTQYFSSASRSRQANTLTARRKIHETRTLSKEEQTRWEATLGEEAASISLEEVSYIRTTEDFFRRFPEPSAIQESMVSPSHFASSQSSSKRSQDLASTDAATPYQNKSSLVPQVPTRPAPALPKQSYGGVSERTKFTSAAIASASPFEYKGTETITGHPTHHCGLFNRGNDCYINSSVQILQGTRILLDVIRQCDLDTTSLPRKMNEKAAPSRLMIYNLQNVFKAISMKSSFYPINLKQYVFGVHVGPPPEDRFGGGRQQDASEFLGWVLSELQKEFNYGRDRGPLKSLTTSQEAVRRDQPVIRSSWMEWQRHCHANDSVITRTVCGQTASSITCPHCGFVQRSWEPWLELNVNVPDKKEEEGSLLESLQESFNKSEEVEGYRCNRCKQYGPRRQDKISRCPEILIIVLGRHDFRQNTVSKKTSLVRFPLTDLSLDPYFISLEGRGSENLDNSFLAPFTYDCYAVIQHLGDVAMQGHYTALIKESDQRNGKDVWYRYNDDVISRIRDIQTETQDRNSYMLFYQRRRTVVNH